MQASLHICESARSYARYPIVVLVEDPMSKNWTQTASAFSVGLGVGALLGLILAPQSGQDTRAYLRDKAQDGIDDAVARSKKVARRAKSVAEDAKTIVGDAVNSGEKAFRHAKNS